jgi:hypothetical protein
MKLKLTDKKRGLKKMKLNLPLNQQNNPAETQAMTNNYLQDSVKILWTL